MTTTRTFMLAAAAILGSGALATAHAADRGQDGRDRAALAAMRVGLPQAIATAEQQAGGRATSAEIEHRGGVASIKVEVAGPQGMRTITVDGTSGQVTNVRDGGADGDND